MIFIVWVFSLWAQSYSGVDINKITELKSSIFQTYETGWMGITKDGIIRVYVADSEEEVQLWMEAMKERLYKYQFPSIEELGDEGYGNPQNILLVREGNIGLLAQGKNSEQWITLLQSLLISEIIPTPAPQLLTLDEQIYQLTIPEGFHFSFIGGTPSYTATGLSFVALPEKIILWSPYAQSSLWIPDQDNTSLTPMEKSLGVQPK